MNLIKEKQKMMEIASRRQRRFSTFSDEVSKTSYYINYEDALHVESCLFEYDFENVAAYRTVLFQLWQNSPSRECIPIILAALSKIENDEMGEVEEMPLYNYSM